MTDPYELAPIEQPDNIAERPRGRVAELEAERDRLKGLLRKLLRKHEGCWGDGCEQIATLASPFGHHELWCEEHAHEGRARHGYVKPYGNDVTRECLKALGNE